MNTAVQEAWTISPDGLKILSLECERAASSDIPKTNITFYISLNSTIFISLLFFCFGFAFNFKIYFELMIYNHQWQILKINLKLKKLKNFIRLKIEDVNIKHGSCIGPKREILLGFVAKRHIKIFNKTNILSWKIQKFIVQFVKFSCIKDFFHLQSQQ